MVLFATCGYGLWGATNVAEFMSGRYMSFVERVEPEEGIEGTGDDLEGGIWELHTIDDTDVHRDGGTEEFQHVLEGTPLDALPCAGDLEITWTLDSIGCESRACGVHGGDSVALGWVATARRR
eukprot:3617972-Amphidinium_carterae.1